MTISPTALKAIEAYGGIELWNKAKTIEAIVSAKGLAFSLKRRPSFVYSKIEMQVDKPHSKLTPIGKHPNISGVLNGQNVSLINERNEIVDERADARNGFPFGRRLFYWDDLDMAYFANYAFWNYLTLPKLLMNEAIQWTEKTDGVLLAKFPKNIPTHNEIQSFIFDRDTGRLIQHNYTAEIISKYAKAANVVYKHAENDSIPYTAMRVVSPRKSNGKALNKPVLIEIKVHSFRLI